MQIKPLHEWNLSPQQAIQLQKQLAYQVIKEDKLAAPIKTVAGIDLGYDAKNDTSRAVAVRRDDEDPSLAAAESMRTGPRDRCGMIIGNPRRRAESLWMSGIAS